MAEYDIECNECGWRGIASELTEETDKSSGTTQAFCPDCGSMDFENLADKKQDETS